MADENSRPERGIARVRTDGRRQLLIYLDPKVIIDTKKAALDLDTTASAVVEEALVEWHQRHSARGAQKT